MKYLKILELLKNGGLTMFGKEIMNGKMAIFIIIILSIIFEVIVSMKIFN